MKDQWYVCVTDTGVVNLSVGSVVQLDEVEDDKLTFRLYGTFDHYTFTSKLFDQHFAATCKYPLVGEYWSNSIDMSTHLVRGVSGNGNIVEMCNNVPGSLICEYDVRDVIRYYKYNAEYMHINKDTVDVIDGAGVLRVRIGKLNDSKCIAEPKQTPMPLMPPSPLVQPETPEGQSFTNSRYYRGRVYRNISSGKQYVVKEMIPERNCALMQVVNSAVECMVSYNHLLRYYTPVEVPRLAEDDKTQTYIREILKRLEGTDTLRPGIEETPERVAKAFDHWFGGYQVNIAELFKTFEDGAEDCDEMVVSRRIPFFSHCEHHMAQIAGFVDIAYIPNGCIVGLSKLNRLVDAYARRLQVQERLTNQIANTIEQYLQPLGVAVRVVATHACIESRGVCDCGGDTVTMAVRGVFKTEPETRHEFLAHCSK